MSSLFLSLLVLQAPSTLASKHAGSDNWLHGCVAAHQALFKGDTKKAEQSLKGLLLYKTAPSTVRKLLISIPKDLKNQRELYKKVSIQCRTHWQNTPKDRSEFVVMTCPMVDADWIQKKGKLENPYAAETMPHCGYQLLPKKKK